MRFSRTDLIPVLAIIAGGAVGVLVSGSLLLGSSPNNVPTPVVVVAPAYPDAAARLQREEELRRRIEEETAEASRRGERLLLQRVLTAVDQAIVQVEELQRQQREVVGAVRGLATEPATRSTAAILIIRRRKDQMAEAVQNLERVLDRSAIVELVSDPTAVMNQAVRILEGAVQIIRESRLREELQFSRGTIEQWDLPSAVTLELNIEADLQALREQLEALPEQPRFTY